MKFTTVHLLVASVILTPAARAATDAKLLENGRAILESNCRRCHAIGKEDTSAHVKAPPFRAVVTRYPAANLAEALAEGIMSGHPDMPEFVFEPNEIDAIVTYLNSLATNSGN